MEEGEERKESEGDIGENRKDRRGEDEEWSWGEKTRRAENRRWNEIEGRGWRSDGNRWVFCSDTLLISCHGVRTAGGPLESPSIASYPISCVCFSVRPPVIHFADALKGAATGEQRTEDPTAELQSGPLLWFIDFLQAESNWFHTHYYSRKDGTRQTNKK